MIRVSGLDISRLCAFARRDRSSLVARSRATDARHTQRGSTGIRASFQLTLPKPCTPSAPPVETQLSFPRFTESSNCSFFLLLFIFPFLLLFFSLFSLVTLFGSRESALRSWRFVTGTRYNFETLFARRNFSFVF